ncbi:MAG: Glu/Leu/Phe/Val dehydrogenase [Parcubacteria group bacterium]|nr:Glu/Leu/Phe/Val dehydrogenase [Parcubacteria group bacterium]
MNIFEHPSFKRHERISHFYDEETGLKSVIAIHNTNLGPALGGLRMTSGDILGQALRLSRGMTYKSALAKLPLGGGKAVILGDPKVDKTERLLRAFARALFTLEGLYISGEDSGINVDNVEVIANEIEKLSRGTPFEGHPFIVGRKKESGGSGNPAPYTAHGVRAAIKSALQFVYGDDRIEGRVFGIPGLGGSVGRNLARRLLEDGGIVVGTEVVPDNLESVLAELDQWRQKITALKDPDAIFGTKMDVFCPCRTAGEILNEETIPRLLCKIVVGATNNQLADEQNDSFRLHNRHILYVPDYVANAGGLIAVAEEYFSKKEGRPYNSEWVYQHVAGIGNTVMEILERSGDSIPPGITANQIGKERVLSAA